MLIGEKKLDNAWKILTKLYGNKTMLANRLKAKLKNYETYNRSARVLFSNKYLSNNIKQVCTFAANSNDLLSKYLNYLDPFI